jgi:hypothetical protein
MSDKFHVYVCARPSDAEILKRDLCRSPAIANNDIGLTVLWNQPSASIGFAQAMEKASADFLVFTHCDVYFPQCWFERLTWEVNRLARIDPNWAVAGFSAMTSSGDMVGRIFDTSLEPITRGLHGKALNAPIPIISTDEMAFVVRREAGVFFDRFLPEFHLYATDFILSAERAGKRSYGLDMPLIHNAKAQLRAGRDYVRSYRYMIRKWADRLPVPTTCGVLTSNPFVPPLRRLRIRYKAICRPSTYSTLRLYDPSTKATELGLPHLLAAPMADNFSLEITAEGVVAWNTSRS